MCALTACLMTEDLFSRPNAFPFGWHPYPVRRGQRLHLSLLNQMITVQLAKLLEKVLSTREGAFVEVYQQMKQLVGPLYRNWLKNLAVATS